MNLTLSLLRTLGSPFCIEKNLYLPGNKEEALELYKYATKNKIGLFYLESLNNKEALENLALEREYEDEKRRHSQQVNTLIRISEILNESDVRYAVFKSLMPFPATPNDVDIIHFGSDDEYKQAVESVLSFGFVEVRGEVDAEQRMFHDSKYGGNPVPHPPKKDVYDVDLYQKISASKMIYLSKDKLRNYVKNVTISNREIKILEPRSELVAIIIHSVIPEMISTLFVYYATLYYLYKMNSEDIEVLINISKENFVSNSIKDHCSLVAELHTFAHGFVPEKINEILSRLDDGNNNGIQKNLIACNYLMPYRYELSSVARILLEKTKEAEFRRCLGDQMIYMLSPKRAKWVINEIIRRRRRDTY